MTVAWENFKLHLSPYLFAIYTLVWSIICILVEFSPLFRSDKYWLPYSIFGCYNLSISILFYTLVAVTSWKKCPLLRIENSDVVGIGATVFFLRLGALFFCIGALVLWCIEFFLAFAENTRPWICIFRTCLFIVFHASQLVFIVKSNRIVFNCHRLFVYFGLAHTIAVNLWVWISLCIAKSGIGKDGNVTYNVTYDRANPWMLHPSESPPVVNIIFERHEIKLRAVKLFGSAAITFLTGNVEFCLIAVGVLISLFYTTSKNEAAHDVRKAHYIGFDYRNTGFALGFGYVLLILFCLSIAFGSIMRDSNYPKAAGSIIGLFQLSYYTISIIACITVFQCLFKHIILNQTFETPAHRDAMSHEKTINVIFLLVGAAGEVIYCSIGLLGVMHGDCLLDSRGLVLTTFVIRALEVLIQAVLLFYLLKKGNNIEPCDTIGKQSITFLIALNMILFGFHTVEGSIRSFGFPTKIDDTSMIFLKISLPLVVFFRFHCSVCFAEIWKISFHLDPRTRSSSGRSSPASTQEVSLESENFEIPSVQTPSLLTIQRNSSTCTCTPGTSPSGYLVPIQRISSDSTPILSVNSASRAPPSRPAPPSSTPLFQSVESENEYLDITEVLHSHL